MCSMVVAAPAPNSQKCRPSCHSGHYRHRSGSGRTGPQVPQGRSRSADNLPRGLTRPLRGSRLGAIVEWPPSGKRTVRPRRPNRLPVLPPIPQAVLAPREPQPRLSARIGVPLVHGSPRRRHGRPSRLGADRRPRPGPQPHRPAARRRLPDRPLRGRDARPGLGPLQGPDLPVRAQRGAAAPRPRHRRARGPRALPRARGGVRARRGPAPVAA